MIRLVKDVVWVPQESDESRIERWALHAAEEIRAATTHEMRWIASAVDSARRHAGSYEWAERQLRRMGCFWLLVIVEPDRTNVVTARLAELGVEWKREA